MIRKWSILAIAMLLVVSLAACNGSQSLTPKNKSGTDSGTADSAEYVTEPITVELWHTFGSGQQAAYMSSAIADFNSTNKYGITVVGNYIGGYVELRTSLSTAIGAGENPPMAVLGMSPILASNNVLADMTPYMERDGFDVDNIFDNMKGTMYYDKAITSLPFLRSTVLFVYNQKLWSSAGFNAPPTTVAELETQAAAVAKKNGIKGFGMAIDPSFYQESLIRSLDGEGIVDADGKGSSCLDDGTMLKMLTDWKSWIDSGWCYRPSLTNTADDMKKMFYAGTLASGLFSSGELSTIATYAKESGVSINATTMPGYNGPYAVSGGGDISIISKNTTAQQRAACWEFIKFLFTDEQMFQRHVQTGYLPVTKSSAETEKMQSFWEENPIYRVAYDYREKIYDPAASLYRSEWNTQVSQAISYVIQDGSKTPAQGIEYLKQMYPTVFME